MDAEFPQTFVLYKIVDQPHVVVSKLRELSIIRRHTSLILRPQFFDFLQVTSYLQVTTCKLFVLISSLLKLVPLKRTHSSLIRDSIHFTSLPRTFYVIREVHRNLAGLLFLST